MFDRLALPRPRFLRDTQGSVSVEAVLIAPLLIWGMVSTYVFFDGFRHKTRAQVAANTVVDVLSRQTATITPQFVDDLNNVFDVLATSRGQTAIRVTSIAQTVSDEPPIIAWSRGTRGVEPALTLSDLTGAVPPILTGEAVVVVETFGTWTPPFALLGLEELVSLSTQVTSRPRFVPWLHFEGSTPVFTHYDPEWADPTNGYDPVSASPSTPGAPGVGNGNGNSGGPNGGTTGGNNGNGVGAGVGNPTVNPTPDPAPPPSAGGCTAQTLVNMNFEGSVTTGWSNSKTEHAAALTRFLGRFGQNDSVTFTHALPGSTSEVTVAFDLHIIDSWDGTNSAHTGPNGDRWQLLVNNEVITSQHFNYTTSAGTAQRTATRAVNGVRYDVRMDMVSAGTNTAFSGWNDQVWRVTLTVTNPPQNFVLGLRSELNSDIQDESWGIDNFTLSVPCGTGATPPPAPTAVVNVAIPFYWSATYENWFTRPSAIPSAEWNTRPFSITGGGNIEARGGNGNWSTSGNLGWDGVSLRLTNPAPGTSHSATLTVGQHIVQYNFARAATP